MPIPGVNEPHYLCKAKSWWNPEWCAGDLFLESSNPHLVFYVIFGWLAELMPLHTVAVVSRLIGLIPLAIGWTLLSRRVCRSEWASMLSVSLFLVIHAAGNWSGEWLVGGIESKTLAYGFLLWSIAQAMQLRFYSSAILAGLAVSFHPIVGVWGVLSATVATFGLLLTSHLFSLKTNVPPTSTWLIAACLFVVASLPGVIPAASIVLNSDPEFSLKATHLQVAYRLSHHLDPMTFSKTSHRYFVMLILIWGGLVASRRTDRLEVRWWRWIVLASLAFALIGVLIAWGPRPIKEMPGYEWRMTALKFYPFRLADILIPVALSFLLAQEIVTRLKGYAWTTSRSRVATVIVVVILTVLSIWIPGADKNPSKMNAETRADWIEVASWIEANTPEADLIHSLENQWAVKWFANRPEYFNYKDCPQDAESLLEWNRRNWVISEWKKSATKDFSVSISELQQLRAETGIRWIVFGKYWKVETQPDFRNKSFRIYKITSGDGSHSGSQ